MLHLCRLNAQFSTYLDEFEGDQLETFLFESLDDFSDQSALNTVRFDHEISAFLVICHICNQAYVSVHWKMWTDRAEIWDRSDGEPSAYSTLVFSKVAMTLQSGINAELTSRLYMQRQV